MEQQYGLVEPFDIDHGELDGISPVEAFVLGCEWWQVYTMLDGDEPISKPIHASNASRIKRMCIRRGRRVKVTPSAEGWQNLEVAGVDGGFRRQEDDEAA